MGGCCSAFCNGIYYFFYYLFYVLLHSMTFSIGDLPHNLLDIIHNILPARLSLARNKGTMQELLSALSDVTGSKYELHSRPRRRRLINIEWLFIACITLTFNTNSFNFPIDTKYNIFRSEMEPELQNEQHKTGTAIDKYFELRMKSTYQ